MVLLAVRATVLTLLLMAASLVFAEALVVTTLILITILMIGTSLVLAPVTTEDTGLTHRGQGPRLAWPAAACKQALVPRFAP